MRNLFSLFLVVFMGLGLYVESLEMLGLAWIMLVVMEFIIIFNKHGNERRQSK